MRRELCDDDSIILKTLFRNIVIHENLQVIGEKTKKKLIVEHQKQHRLMGELNCLYINDLMKDLFAILNYSFESTIIIHRTFIEFF